MMFSSSRNLEEQDSSNNSFNSTKSNTIDWSLIFYPTSLYSGLYSLLLLVITIWVILGNSLVCIGTIKTYRPGQITTLYLCYESSLDVFIGICLLPIMSIAKLIGHFPYGDTACNLFVFWDYYIIIASSFGHFGLITVFFWEVKSPSTVPRAAAFHLKIIAGLWFGVLFVWLPSYFADLYTPDPAGAPAGTELVPITQSCGYNYHNNIIGATYLGLFGFIIPYFIGLVLCGWSMLILWKKKQSRAEIQGMYVQQKDKSRRIILEQGFSKYRRQPDAPGPLANDERPTIIKPFCTENTSHGLNSASSTKVEIGHEAALVYAIFITFSLLRTPFYIYFVLGIFESATFSLDISLGIYWIMDINSVISCALHLSLTSAVRAGVKSFFCSLPCSKSRRNVNDQVVILSNMNDLRRAAGNNEYPNPGNCNNEKETNNNYKKFLRH